MADISSSGSDVLNVTLHIFCYLLIGGWAFLATFHALGLVYGLYKFHRKPSHSNLKELPGVSIIKPLTGIDTNLYENLKTFFNLQYPRYEILFCVQEHDNELIDLIERLREQYPHVDSKLFVGSQKFPSGDKSLKTSTIEIKNPKIFNMLPAYEKAQYPYILISDSGLMMHEHTLYDMAICMTDTVGLVHQMPFTCDRKGFAGSVEKVYFGTQHARMYMTINLIGINCVTGMSCLIRKECLDRVGGLRAFGNYIAEDYYIAYEVAKQGWKLRVAPTPAQQNSGEYSVSIWTERMIRWCKLRMRLSPLAYLEPLQECFSSAILAGIVTNYLFEWNALVVAACHILIWFILDYLMLRITQGGPLPFSKFEFAIAWLVREFSSFYIYFKAFTGSSTVKWRGKEYRLGSGTRAEDLSPSPSPPPAPSLIESSSPSSSTQSSSSSNLTLPVAGPHLLSSSLSTKQASQLV
jgi:ceramide glucosyltransferase